MNPSQSSVPLAPKPLRVMLVEDSPVLAHRLRELLDQLPDLNLVGTVDSEKAAIQAASDTDLDVMILDLHLKQGTGFGVLRATKDLCKRPVVIILTNYALPQYRTEANMLGVRYFLDKAREFERLADVLHEIAHPAKPPSN